MNLDASLVDLGGGVLGLEFHSKLNIIGVGTVDAMFDAVEALDARFDAMVVANHGAVFSAGANLAFFLESARAAEFHRISVFIQRFQAALLALKRARKPVVAAPFSRALGGGCEVVLHCHRAQAFMELFMGLVEYNVGLLPAGGGTTELALRFADPLDAMRLLAAAKVSTSAREAREMGLLRALDRISIDAHRHHGEARAFALELAPNFQPAEPQFLIATGEPGYQRMIAAIPPGDVVLQNVAHILSGGRCAAETLVPEERLRELELEAFLSLCGSPESQARMERVLTKRKGPSPA
jgi:3-hydroxyacyl-CoA dehydrogenase